MKRKDILVVIVGAMIVISLGLLAMCIYYRPASDGQATTATVKAMEMRIRATIAAEQATEDAKQLDEETRNRNATATAEAEKSATSLAATSTVQAASSRATRTAEASSTQATATAKAGALHCRYPSSYSASVSTAPKLWPDPGYLFVTDKAWPDVRATWTVTNTSDCEWREVSLKTPDREGAKVELQRSEEDITKVQPGEAVKVIRHFPRLQAPKEGEWILVINGLTLFDLPHLKMDLGEEIWVIARAPTSTPPPTDTPKPMPQPSTQDDDNDDNEESPLATPTHYRE